jgi:predicted lactoylglutathione lyase
MHCSLVLEARRKAQMPKMIFVNLPLKELEKEKASYQAIGFENNPQFADDTANCMVWSEAINDMLLTHGKWRSFTDRPIPLSTSSEVLLAFSCDDISAVDTMLAAATAHGSIADIKSRQDCG